MADSLTERAEALVAGVIEPLVLGGEIKMVRPIGAHLALELCRERSIVDRDRAAKIELGRLRRARSAAPVDVLPPLSPAEWALAAAVNDLLQVTNHKLASFVSRGRHDTLLENVTSLCAQIPPPATLEQALARHATFAQVLDIVRTDTKVQTWTGAFQYRGEPLKRDDFVWPQLRKVQVEATKLPLRHMAHDAPVEDDAYELAVTRLLQCTPLTDLATSGRPSPPFRWSVSTLAIVSARGGAQLAINAIQPFGHYAKALDAVGKGFEKHKPVRETAGRFVQGLEQAIAHWTATA